MKLFKQESVADAVFIRSVSAAVIPNFANRSFNLWQYA